MVNKSMPLEGVRVLDIASLYAAPYAATLLGDFGAEVIKVEPPEGDGFRNTGMWAAVGRNKKSVTLDLREPAGVESLLKLAESCDVVVQNYPREVLERRGMSWEIFHARNPRLIMVSVSCFGQSGPYADFPGSGTIGEGFAGLTALTGWPDQMPLLSSVALGDAIGAMSAVIGTLTALYWRDARKGTGQEIDVSLYEPVLTAISGALAEWQPGRSPTRLGGRLANSPIRNTYRTSDNQYVVVSVSTPRHFAEFAELSGRTESDDADATLAAWISRHPLAQVLEIFRRRRLPIAPVNHVEDLLNDPHVQHRGSVRRTTINERDVAYSAPHPVLNETPGRTEAHCSALGEHNDELLRALTSAT